MHQTKKNRIMKTEETLFKYWWVSLIVGFLSIATGICCFVTPANSLIALTSFFIFALAAGGIINIVWACTNRKRNDSWGWELARGIMEFLFAIWLYMLPLPFIATVLIYFVGFWMMFNSIIGICESAGLSKLAVKGWGWLLACNILSLICSFVFLITPTFGGIFILFFIGAAFILYGIYRIILSFKWREYNKRAKEDNEEILEVEVIEDEY